MKDLPLVSVVAVCYNHAKYVVETLDSIKNQTYSNIELIIMDDCSTDNSVEVIEDWISKNNYNCKFIAHQENKGLCATLNEAITYVIGIYTQLIACDDILGYRKFEIQVNALEKTDDSTLLCCSNFSHINENSDVIRKNFFDDNFKFPVKTFEAILNGSQGYGIITHSPTVLLKSYVFQKTGNFPEDMIQEDLYMWLKITFNHKAIYINEVLVKYRILSSSLSKTPIYKERIYLDRILVGSLFLKKDIGQQRKQALLKHNNRYVRHFLKERLKNNEYVKFVVNKISENDYLLVKNRSDVELLIEQIFRRNLRLRFLLFRIERKLKKWI